MKTKMRPETFDRKLTELQSRYPRQGTRARVQNELPDLKVEQRTAPCSNTFAPVVNWKKP